LFLLFFQTICFTQKAVTDTEINMSVDDKLILWRENMLKEFDRYQKLDKSFSQLKKQTLNPLNSVRERNLYLAKWVLARLEAKEIHDTLSVDSLHFSKRILAFQKRHLLKETGKWTEKLISLILSDITLTQKKLRNSIRRLDAVVMKKGSLVYINIPDYSLHYYDTTGTEILKCAVIVGKPSWKTMTMQSQIDNIVFCPFWNVPESILKKEILSLMRKNPNYLKENRMEWFQGRLRQKPGIDNSLGLIKFNFNNPFHIYLHDTPGKSNFKKQKRAFSHGCIRLSCVDDLAMLLLDKKQDWIEARKGECNQGKEKKYNVEKETVILVTYLTSWVDDLGRVQVRDDIYGWDK
jgi:murein L,D-transpeptidase YcbB/YkuD